MDAAPAGNVRTGKAGAGLWRRAWVVHPLLFAAYPVLYLWARNLREGIVFRDVLGPLAVLAGASIALTLAGTLLFRNGPKAGLAVSVLVLMFFSYGYLLSAVQERRVAGFVLGRSAVLLPAWVTLAALAMLLVVRVPGRLPNLTQILNVVAAGMVLLNLVPILAFEVRGSGAGPQALESGDPRIPASPVQVSGRPRRPDVYYIILDEYAGAETLRDQFDFDNGPFLQFLRNEGFYVPDESSTNYPRTNLSLASSLNLEYLDRLTRRYGRASGNGAPTVELMQDNRIGRLIKGLGYTYIQMGSWWAPTAKSPLADVNVTFGGPSEFASILYRTTALAPLATDSFRRREWKRVQFEFDALTRLDRFRGPRFVFAHLLIPHDPIIFDRGGRYLTPAQAAAEGTPKGYVNQLMYANDRMQDVVSKLLSGPPEKRPVIIIQSDEGPYAGAPTAWSKTPDPDTLQRKFDILNAYYLPGVALEGSGLYPSITPVNSFRLVLDLYFGAALPLLPDRNSTFSSLDRIYDFTDVTSLVRGVIRPDSGVAPSPGPSG